MEWTADLDAQAAHMRENLSTLVPRELEALKMIGRGLTNQEIAVSMGVTVNTVRTWAKNIHDKLCVTGRARLAVLSHHMFCRGGQHDGRA